MLKVLVIDDEKLVRQMVMRCIDWEKLGFQIVGEASSARMGMELAEEQHPDLIVMDIRMPSMDGLTCSRLVLEKHPQMKIIILSGHDEFEYASEGIRIGIFDYLLKPINAEELEQAAVKARDAILAERDHREEFRRFKEELEKHSGYIRDRQLAAMVRSAQPRQYLESLEYFQVKISDGCFQAALVEVFEEEKTEEEKLLLKMHVRKIMEDYYGGHPRIYVVDSGADWLILFNNEEENSIYDSSEELKKYLENNLDARVCIGVGNVYTELENLRESYREAKDAVKYHFVSDEDVIFYRDIYPYSHREGTAAASEEALREFGNAIRISNVVKAEEVLNRVFAGYKRNGGERSQVLITSLQLLSEVMKAVTELKTDVPTEKLNYPVLLEEIFAGQSLEKIQDSLRQVIQDACLLIGREVSDQEKNLVHKVRDYLQEHYGDEEISLNGLASMYYVNASYLSRVFKEKTGKTFSSYLFDLRMQEAKQLVEQTDLKAYEIAERVGIADPHYFSSCFKKFTGMSVSDYRRQK